MKIYLREGIMTRYFKFLYYLLFYFFLINTTQAQQKEKLRIALLDFSTPGGLSKMETVTLGNRLRSMLVRTNAFLVIERGKMEEILDEQGFQKTGCTTTECAVEIGRLLNVQKMVSGAIGKVGQTYTIDISLIDIATAQIERSFVRDYKGEIDELLDIMEVIANQLASATTEKPKPTIEEKKLYRLSIKSNPPDARIFINNTGAGTTPFSSDVREGLRLMIRLKKENYKDWVRSLTVNDDVDINTSLEFTEQYKQELAQKAKEQRGEQITEEKGGGGAWIWIGGGAVLLGGAAYLLIPKGEDDKVTNGGNGDSGFPSPPGRPPQ
jgi:hypothetical protein